MKTDMTDFTQFKQKPMSCTMQTEHNLHNVSNTACSWNVMAFLSFGLATVDRQRRGSSNYGSIRIPI